MPNLFHDVILPQIISYRSRKELSVQLDHFESDSGDKSVVVNSRVIFNYSVMFGKRTSAQLAELRRFYLCRQGPLACFRFTDPLDNTSSGNPVVAATDQPVIKIKDQYFLAKQYGLSYRIIRLPRTSTIIFADNGNPVSAAVNGRTGRVTGYAGGDGFTWGGSFDVPSRFSTGFMPTYAEYNDADLELGLMEVLDVLDN